MTLPKIAIPMFSIILPSTGKSVMLRSMTTKEYKLLLIAKETADDEQEIITIKQVLNNCICDDLDIDNLTWYDAEYLFTKLVISSKAEKGVTQFYKCKAKIDEQVCGMVNEIYINIDEAVISINTNELLLKSKDVDTNEIIMKFTYPTLGNMSKFKTVVNEEDKINFFNELLTVVSSGEDIYIKGRDFDALEAGIMIDALTETQLEELIKFIDDMPQIKLDHSFLCQKCGTNHKIELRGMNDFFY